jgi:outer membrane protein TolC
MTLTQRQFRGGQIDRLALITSEQANRQAQLNLAQARAARLGSAAALFQALGGGWWHRTEEDATAAAPATSVPATL